MLSSRFVWATPKSVKPDSTSESIFWPLSVSPASSWMPSGPTASSRPFHDTMDSKLKLSYQPIAVVSVFMTHALDVGSLNQTSEVASAEELMDSTTSVCTCTIDVPLAVESSR